MVATEVVFVGFGVVGVTNRIEGFGGGDVLALGPFLKEKIIYHLKPHFMSCASPILPCWRRPLLFPHDQCEVRPRRGVSLVDVSNKIVRMLNVGGRCS